MSKKAHYILVVKKNQPGLYAQVKNLPWRHIPVGARQHAGATAARSAAPSRPLLSPPGSPSRTPPRPHLTRHIRPLDGGKWRTITVYAITSLDAHQATPAQLAAWIRGHWQIEALHHIRDVSYGEDASQMRAGSVRGGKGNFKALFEAIEREQARRGNL